MAKRRAVNTANGHATCLFIGGEEVKMTREEMLNLREIVYKEYKKRVDLGEFDANAGAIQLCLHTLVDIINHTLEEMKKKPKISHDQSD